MWYPFSNSHFQFCVARRDAVSRGAGCEICIFWRSTRELSCSFSVSVSTSKRDQSFRILKNLKTPTILRSLTSFPRSVIHSLELLQKQNLSQQFLDFWQLLSRGLFGLQKCICHLVVSLQQIDTVKRFNYRENYFFAELSINSCFCIWCKRMRKLFSPAL